MASPSTTLKAFTIRFVGRGMHWVAALALVVAIGTAAYVVGTAWGTDWHPLVTLLIGLATGWMLFWISRGRRQIRATGIAALNRANESLARHVERLRILQEIDQALIADKSPEAIAGAVIQPLRELLGAARAVVNIFDLKAGEVEWLAAAGRRRVHIGAGVRYSMHLMGDVGALRKGKPQLIDTRSLPPGPEVDALLASGVEVYMVVPMIAAGELIGALSFGGAPAPFRAEQLNIAREAAAQLAIMMTQARLHERVKHLAEELELRVGERTQELAAAHAELQRNNADLQRSTAELQDANSELEAFSDSVSHDLRGPLRAIDGFSRILKEEHGKQLGDEGRRLVSVVCNSAARMGQLIDDLLAFSRFRRAVILLAEIDMSALVRDVIAELTQTKGIPCTIDVALLPSAEGDSALLRQVWINLIGNAIKYSSKRAQPRVEICGRVENGNAVYCVKDNGAGFDMAYYHKLFVAFERLHTGDQFSGTGVGLAIVRRIVTRHGGKVWAESRPDDGASFSFSIPLSEEIVPLA
jgi:signal transduction histidine kinase